MIRVISENCITNLWKTHFQKTKRPPNRTIFPNILSQSLQAVDSLDRQRRLDGSYHLCTVQPLCTHQGGLRVNLQRLQGVEEIELSQKTYTSELCKKVEWLLKKQKYPEALDCCDEILKFEPENLEVIRHKACALGSLSRLEEELQCFTEILEHDPCNYDTLYWKADLLYCLKRYQESLEFYDKTLAVDKNDVDSLKGKARVFNKIGKYEQAKILSEKALDVCPKDSDALFLRNCAIDNLGKNWGLYS